MKTKFFFIPLLLVLLYAPFSAQLDLWLSRQFYQNGHFESSSLLEGLFTYGFWPAWGLVGLAGMVLIFSLFSPACSKWRCCSLYLLLTLSIGSGLLIHAVFKDHWGRPRPRQVIEFGGQQPFRPFYSPQLGAQPEPSKSFPCGHCSMGFYFFALGLIGLAYRNKALAYGAFGWALFMGIALGYARIAQGGHFLSDVVFSALIMLWTALLLLPIVKPTSQWN